MSFAQVSWPVCRPGWRRRLHCSFESGRMLPVVTDIVYWRKTQEHTPRRFWVLPSSFVSVLLYSSSAAVCHVYLLMRSCAKAVACVSA